MKKTARYRIVLLSLALCAGLLAGCGNSYTAKDLVKDTLDLYFLDSPSERYLEQVNMTAEEAHDAFEHWLSLEIPFFCREFEVELDSCQAQIETQIVELYHEIYRHSKYEVGESGKSGSAYPVEVTIYPIDILQKVFDSYLDGYAADFNERIASGAYDGISEVEFETLWAQGVIDLVNEHLGELDHLAPETMTVRVEKDTDGLYFVNTEDFQRADELILAY